ncbi:XRE family transcriptional regulator [Sulfurimonas diazotrophicus]|uniref:XRE family transcriptional regulator n=1 Tax=Sulfurimonas diazotrophicus TaxID=3131939 RepID=A0ABZ3H6H3_9BACT
MIGERLQRARESASLSLRALAEKVCVSQTTISKYEKNITMPDSEMLLKLSKALDVKTAYFYRTDSFVLENIEYRKRDIPSTELRTIESKILDQVEKRFEIESLFPKPPFESFTIPNIVRKKINFLKEIDKIAYELRNTWELGYDPISDLSDILELHGIKIFMIDENADNNFDGLAAKVNGEQIIVVSKNWPGDRQRFTLAHELGHLLLEKKLGPKLDEEKASDRFAGAFLLPAIPLINRLGTFRKNIEIAELALIKEEFGVSMQTVFIRANHAGIINYFCSNNLWKLFKKNGWNINEPGRDYPGEKLYVFKQLVLRALSEDLIVESKAADALNMSLAKFKKFRNSGK